MNEGLFWSSYNESISLIKQLGLFKDENVHQYIPYSSTCAAYSRGTDYRELYQNFIDNRDYDILLSDDSLIQMSRVNGESRFVYIQNPQRIVSFESFLIDNGFDLTLESVSELKGVFSDDYSQVLEGMPLNSGAVYFRYDEDSRGRKNNENVHAFAHLHVGLNNDIRIPVSVHMIPQAFVAFVIRHVYYDVWTEAIRNSQIALDYKERCPNLPEVLWTEVEKQDFYLG